MMLMYVRGSPYKLPPFEGGGEGRGALMDHGKPRDTANGAFSSAGEDLIQKYTKLETGVV